ncbi:hypothetical protein B0H16DRAFT_1457380 [Mycena metata]|uniref:Uncharacterized protein n=1 Tax=Mycena metata TaxID=1033252 RepID=A0AAD7J7D8_9AGAR|nr:hypothetical protein B0H16DRAFT_1457380 [Mycena metata]
MQFFKLAALVSALIVGTNAVALSEDKHISIMKKQTESLLNNLSAITVSTLQGDITFDLVSGSRTWVVIALTGIRLEVFQLTCDTEHLIFLTVYPELELSRADLYWTRCNWTLLYVTSGVPSSHSLLSIDSQTEAAVICMSDIRAVKRLQLADDLPAVRCEQYSNLKRWFVIPLHDDKK